MKNFNPTQEFFETCRLRRIRNLKNMKLSEPSQLVGQYFLEAMYTDFPLRDQMIEVLEHLTYEDFLT